MSIEQTVELPGGILFDGKLRRDVIFKPLTGYIEKKIEEIRNTENDPVSYVSRVLMNSLKSIAGKTPEYDVVNSLSVVDRQFLMLQLAIVLDGENIWLQPKCKQCNARYDVKINRKELPVETSKDSYPYANVSIAEKEIKLRIPQGKDQFGLLNLSTKQIVYSLLKSCIETVNKHQPGDEFIRCLTNSDIEAIESALDKISPAICTQLSAVCPECASREEIQLNPYMLARTSDETLFNDIHYIASHYHWSEQAILDLPRERRQHYLRLIDAHHGIYT